MQEPGALGTDPRLEPGTDLRVRRRDLEAVEQRAHVQTRAAHDHRAGAPGEDPRDVGARVRLVPGHRRLLGDIQHVQLVVRHTRPLGRRQLGRADVHPAVELHGVGVDHLSPETQREGDPEVRLPGRRGADDGDGHHSHDTAA